nr:Bacterial regulatory protein, tetR family [uncultured organism]
MDEAVREAATREFTESGILGFSMDRVASAAGVNRTTIYRRWPSRSELIRSVIEPMLERYDVAPDTGSVVVDLAVLMRTIRDTSGLPLGRAFTDATVTTAGELAALTDAVRDKAMAPFLEVLTRAAGRGEIPSGEVSLRAHLAFFGIVMWRQTHDSEASDEECGWLASVVTAAGNQPSNR